MARSMCKDATFGFISPLDAYDRASGKGARWPGRQDVADQQLRCLEGCLSDLLGSRVPSGLELGLCLSYFFSTHALALDA